MNQFSATWRYPTITEIQLEHRRLLDRLMARRHAAARAAGRTPGVTGRPITSTHSRAAYWREWKRKRAGEPTPEKQSQP